MRDKERLPSIVLALLCLVLAIATISLFRYTGRITADFKKKEAEFIAKTTEYKNKLGSLQTAIDEKTSALADAEKRTKEVEDEIAKLREEGDKLRAEFDTEKKNFQKRSLELKQRLDVFEEAPVESLIRKALEKEENDGVRRLLQESVSRVELIRSGKAVDLEPIVVSTGEGVRGGDAIEAAPAITVVALDKKNRLIAINAGRREKLKEGDRLVIMRDGKTLASAGIVAVRYRVATALIDQSRNNFSVKDIREGDEVVREK